VGRAIAVLGEGVALARPSHQLYPSPLRYPGGKGKLANFLKLVMVENRLVGTEYVEPYAGGAAVALSLLFEEYASHIHINDVNRSVSTFWRVVLEQPDALCRRITTVSVDVEEWDRQRAVQAEPDPDELDLAFSTFFMNRTNRSGIIGGGIIGGRRQAGAWGIDARWKPSDLISRIQKIARFRSRITVTDLDAADYLEHVLPTLDSPFLYLDPPYYEKGRRLYEDYYEHADHAQIAKLVLELQHPWMVSYDASAAIDSLYESVAGLRYGLNYTARHRFVGSENMFFSNQLRVPDEPSPATVSLAAINQARSAVSAASTVG
jgi:DNA adenine methylase